MYPSVAYLYVCPVEMEKYLNRNLKYWFNYNNLNFEPFAKVMKHTLLEKPIIETIDKSQMIDDEKILASFDLKTVKIEDLESIQSFNINFYANKRTSLHGFAFWFDVIFTTDNNIVTLSTAPNSAATHWKQTIAFLPGALDLFFGNKNLKSTEKEEILQLEEDDQFQCFVIMNQSDENPRHYVIDMGVDLNKEIEPIDNDEEDITSDDFDDDEEEHIIPCDCSRMRCVLIKATLQKYENQDSANKE